MKKILSVTFAFMLFAIWSFAAPFSPTPLEISVQDKIIYPFDGTEVDIPVDVSGKPSKCYLIINTRLPEDQLPHRVKNGFIGWHYVNRIDTTVYISGAYNFEPGSHTITWDGYGTENTGGGYGGTYEKSDPVSPGTYDYYVWGYDDQSTRERVCNFLPVSFYWQPQYTTFSEYDEAGLPRTNPLIRGNIPWMYDNLHGVGPPRWTAFKFELGNDPNDVRKLQTTFMPGFSEEDQYDASPISFDPFDQNCFYCMHVYTTQKKGELHKWNWVGDGNAEIVEEWGDRDNLLLTLATRSGMGEYMPAVTNDTRYIYITSPGRNPYEIQHDVLYIISFDGKLLVAQMLDDFYTPDAWAKTYTNGTVNRMFAHRDHPYQLVCGGEQHCMMEMIGCDRLVNDEGDDEYVMWENGNGDYFLDGSWNPEISTHPWQCNTGEYTNENMGRHNEQFWDSEGIMMAFVDYQGLYSFVVCTQDGSGVAYCKFADDTDASNTNRKGSGQRVDIGSQFDGLYISDVVSDELNYGAATQHINWVAFDSDHGIITTNPLQKYMLTMVVNQAGLGTIDPYPGEHEYYENMIVTITAIPASGYRFVNWTGDVADPASASTTVTMDGNKTVSVNFEIIPEYTFTTAVNQAEWGTIDPPVGDHIYYEDTIVNITAMPDSGYRFVNWTGDVAEPTSASTTVTMKGNKTVTANFWIVSQYILTMAVNQAGWGTTNLTVGYHYYDKNTVVTITASPASGYEFVGWTGDVEDSNSAYTTAAMNSDKNVTANFIESFPVYWSPAPLEISVQEEILYGFDGTDVEFTVDVAGKPARCWLIINTRLPETQLPHQVTNGFLGWHYVNRIDTTVYVSPPYNFAPGSHTITWDGCGTENTSGGYGGTYEKYDPVAPGTYDYYIWAYDDQSQREKVCNFLPISFYWQPQYTKFSEYYKTGLPRANPLIWGNIPWMYNNLHGVGPPRWTAFKFPLGSDPDDTSKLQTTFMAGFSEDDQYDTSPISFDPFDQNYFYNLHVYTEQKMGAMFKWHWVSDGNAEIVDEWGGWDDLALTTASRSGMDEYMPAVTNDTRYIYITSPGRNPYEIQHDVLYIISFDGEKVNEGQMLDDFYTPYGYSTYSNGQINRLFASREFPYQVIMGGELHCMMEMVDTSRLIADEGDDEYVMWKNGNGDYFLDANWNPEISTHHWDCNTGGEYKYNNENMGRHNEQFWDSEGIVMAFVDYQGLYSFVVCTQDGSGVAYCKFADDTNASNTNRKGSGQRVDIGGAYDGLYIGDVVGDELNYGAATQHINWVAFDSAHGVITREPVTVEEESKTAFSVDAAYPNPANPTTTIGFTLAEAGHVTVDIYNIAGQKVDTLVDEKMSAGKHSVVWNGSGFSAGVYFYTFKSGKFSKTMKVTLLK